VPPETDKTAMNFLRSLPETRWQSCRSPGPQGFVDATMLYA
jgi:hypothetical protein